MRRTVVLLIIDGFGIGGKDESNPVYAAKPKNLKWLEENFPVTSLQASGITVGLPWGEAGNSDVGHLTLGAGKVIYQYFPRISLSARDGTFFENPALKAAFSHAKKNNSAVNLVGIISKANTHSSLEHLKALLKFAEKENISNINLHLISDGKDSPPKTIMEILKMIPEEKIGTITGRYYAMDQKQNWTLTQRAYECLVGKSNEVNPNYINALENLYNKGATEEFLPPLIVNPQKVIKENEAVIFFNFREDGMKQLVSPFAQKDFNKFERLEFSNLFITTMTLYSEEFNAAVAYPPETIDMPLGLVISNSGKNQLKLTETYKYNHITYFFNGHREQPFKNEYRVVIPSLPTPNLEKEPQMMAKAITDRLTEAIESGGFDFVAANYANLDLIGHTPDYNAALKAIAVIDEEIGRVIKSALQKNAIVLITSDHGNIEQSLDPVTLKPHTQHTTNPVPFYLVGKEFKGRKFVNWKNYEMETAGIISDVAPTILDLLGMPKPAEMDGRSLLQSLII